MSDDFELNSTSVDLVPETTPNANVVVEADGRIATKWPANKFISKAAVWVKHQKELGVAKPDFDAFKREHGPDKLSYEAHPEFQAADAEFKRHLLVWEEKKTQWALDYPLAHKARLLRIKQKRETNSLKDKVKPDFLRDNAKVPPELAMEVMTLMQEYRARDETRGEEMMQVFKRSRMDAEQCVMNVFSKVFA